MLSGELQLNYRSCKITLCTGLVECQTCVTLKPLIIVSPRTNVRIKKNLAIMIICIVEAIHAKAIDKMTGNPLDSSVL
jgi:hypothetical protein